MGKKTHPILLRTGYLYQSPSKWYSKDKYADFVREDSVIRDLIEKKWKEAMVDRVEIERGGARLTISVAVAKPGLAIGKKGSGAEELKLSLAKKIGIKPQELSIHIAEVHDPSSSARVIAQQTASDLERRIPFRRVMKGAIERVMKTDAKGVKIAVSGRLNGADIARTEILSEGTVPLHTLRADIDYALAEAHTTYGVIGIKVWIYKGEIFV